MRKITSYGKKNGFRYGKKTSGSNYIYSQEGCESAKKAFVNTINEQPFDGKQIENALNAKKNIIYKFTLHSEDLKAGYILLEAADKNGNRYMVKITNA